MTFIAASSSSSAFAQQMLSPFLCAPPETSVFTGAGGEACLLGSTAAYVASGAPSFPVNGGNEGEGCSLHFNNLPERATPENAHLFPALLREIEQIETSVHHARLYAENALRQLEQASS